MIKEVKMNFGTKTIGAISPLLISSLLSISFLSGCIPQSSEDEENQEAALAIKQTKIQQNQESLARFADHLLVSYSVIGNSHKQGCDAKKADGTCFYASLSLFPKEAFTSDEWEIYFSHIRPIQSDDSDEFDIEFINGDLHRLIPTKKFKGFIANKAIDIKFRADNWQLAESDIMPNFYIVSGNLKPRLIRSTAIKKDETTRQEIMGFVQPFDDAKQFQRYDTDKTLRATSQRLFTANKDVGFQQPNKLAIIPSPKNIQIKAKDKNLRIEDGIRPIYEGLNLSDIEAGLNRLTKLGIETSIKGVELRLKLKSSLTLNSGGYELNIDENSINISGKDLEGINNGISTLASLYMLGEPTLPLIAITDEPRFEYRGLHIDIARNFHSKALILKLLDQMATYKLNKLHLHMADDEGWRLQIPGLEELTTVGSKRCHDLSEQTCLLPQLGSGPNHNNQVNGFYTVDDYIDIVKAAQSRQIQVIPSLDMPGHARAAIKSMEARYNRLIAQEKSAEANQFRLIDPDDITQYSSVQHYNDNTINVCLESSYDFIEKVIKEMKSMHEIAGQPLSLYHIGADETAGAWLKSPKCESLISSKNGPDSIEAMGQYFIQRISNILSKQGIATAAWNDGLEHLKGSQLEVSPYSYNWAPLFWEGHKSAHEHANRGWPVVVSSSDVTYFDIPYEADPKEPGNYWASRHTNTRKVFSFMPENLPVHAQVWRDNTEATFSLKDEKPLAKGIQFKGLQAQLWSEAVRSDEQVEYMLFPRLIALAERAWHKASWETPYSHEGGEFNHQSNIVSTEKEQRLDWQNFANTMSLKEFPKLDLLGINYRIPTVGAIKQNNQLIANVIFPGLPIQYRLNTGEWLDYSKPVDVQDVDNVEVRALSTNRKRIGRSITMKM
jgi:hexosaminidase